MAHIGINTAKAREIHKEHIRVKRNPLLAAQDIEFQKPRNWSKHCRYCFYQASTS